MLTNQPQKLSNTENDLQGDHFPKRSEAPSGTKFHPNQIIDSILCRSGASTESERNFCEISF